MDDYCGGGGGGGRAGAWGPPGWIFISGFEAAPSPGGVTYYEQPQARLQGLIWH